MHLRQATQVARLAQKFQSAIWLRLGAKAANARSILSVLTLCATMGARLEIEAVGEDETEAVAAFEEVFTTSEADHSAAGPYQVDT